MTRVKAACICPGAFHGGCGRYSCPHHNDGLPHARKRSCSTPCRFTLRGNGLSRGSKGRKMPKCDDARHRDYARDPGVKKVLEEEF
jgi:hypothetical protein